MFKNNKTINIYLKRRVFKDIKDKKAKVKKLS